MRRFLAILLLLLPLAPVLASAELQPIGWGVVTTAEPKAYDKTGKSMTTLKAGEIFSVLKAVSLNKTPAYYIEVHRKTSRRCVLASADCKVFLELPDADNVSAQNELKQFQQLLSDYYLTLALRDSLLTRARTRHFASSPAKRLEELKTELAGVPDKDRAYAAAQEKAKSNAERLRYRDLRKELRYRTTGLQQEIERVKAETEAWTRAHPFDDSTIRSSSVWKRLTAQLREKEELLVPLAGISPAAE